MDFNHYQAMARTTAIYPNLGDNLWYPALGLVGEAGEVAEKIKKIYRDSEGIISSKTVEQLSGELGDVLWYIANLASELGLELELVAARNLYKLSERKNRGTLHGSGDNR